MLGVLLVDMPDKSIKCPEVLQEFSKSSPEVLQEFSRSSSFAAIRITAAQDAMCKMLFRCRCLPAQIE